MKELSLLVEQSEGQMPACFFCLSLDREKEIVLEAGKLLDDLRTIISLDEVLSQDDREQAFFFQQQ